MWRVKQRQFVEDSRIHERLGEIEARAQTIHQQYIATEWIPRHDMSFIWWTYWEASNYTIYPFPGGMADQPDWLWYDFTGFNAISEYEELGYERERLLKRLQPTK